LIFEAAGVFPAAFLRSGENPEMKDLKKEDIPHEKTE